MHEFVAPGLISWLSFNELNSAKMKWLVLLSLLTYMTPRGKEEVPTRSYTYSDTGKIKVSYVKPQRIVKVKEGHYLIDFGKVNHF